MTEPLRASFKIEESLPADLQMMSIWVQAMELHFNSLSPEEFMAATNWFKTHMDLKIKEHINNKYGE